MDNLQVLEFLVGLQKLFGNKVHVPLSDSVQESGNTQSEHEQSDSDVRQGYQGRDQFRGQGSINGNGVDDADGADEPKEDEGELDSDHARKRHELLELSLVELELRGHTVHDIVRLKEKRKNRES